MATMIWTDKALSAMGADAPALGGKVNGLVRLVRASCRVPPFFAISAELTGADPLREQVSAALAALGDGPYAVRSSAAAEDGASASWAGQFESVLGVRDLDQVLAAVDVCRASATSERVRAYSERIARDVGPMTVIVQRLILGEASGVCFSRDPERPEWVLLSVGLGLGEGVVQGQVPCDTVRVDAHGKVLQELANKDERVVLRDGATTSEAVSGSLATEAALSEPQVQGLAQLARRLDGELGYPVDLEFTMAAGTLWVLQARPVTAPMARGRRLLWDNSNIIESYAGITTPLTYSFASRAYTIVYQLFHRVMGVDETTIRRMEPTYRRTIGLMRGRIFYNLNAWYDLVRELPGYSFNKQAMETMMGVGEVAGAQDAGEVAAGWGRRIKDVWRFTQLGWRLFRIDADARSFRQHFRKTLQRSQAQPLADMAPDDLLALYEETERELLWAWTTPIVNDFFCMIFYALLRKQCVALTGDEATQLHSRLLAGEGLESARPAQELLALARYIAQRDGLRLTLLQEAPAEAVLAELLQDRGFADRWTGWMRDYGARSPDELKLESPTLADTPEFLLHALRGWVRTPPKPADDVAARAQAEREAEALHSSKPRAMFFRWVTRQARARVGTREALRFERTRVFGFVRELFRAFGDRYVDAGALDRRDDVFYLTVDEVLGYARGTTVSVDLRGLVRLRRAEFAGYQLEPAPDDRFVTFGAVHLHNRFVGPPKPPQVFSDALVGTACAPGRVSAPARVITDPRAVPDLQGGLLVAYRTDPGWVPLFPTASGVLVERGSLLSHSAVVARELGLPAIVGLAGLMSWAKDGEILHMDGAAGTVRRDADGQA